MLGWVIMAMLLPSPKQSKALNYLTDNTTNFVGYGGAAHSGKSHLLCKWITNMSLMFADTGWGIGRRELVTLKKTTLISLFKVFDEMHIKADRDYSYNQTLNVITFNNKSQIFLIDMAYKPADPLYQRFGGYELTGAAVDESAESPLEGINILYTRLGRRNNAKYNLIPKLLETFNPAKTHVYFRYYKPDKEGSLKSTYAFIKALPQDNPSPETEAYVKSILDNSDPITVQRLIYGNFEYDDDPTLLINYDSSLNMFTNKHVYLNDKGEVKQEKRYITADIAFYGSDLFVLFVWNGWSIIDAHVMQKSNGKDVENAIKEMAIKHRVSQTNICYDADGLGSFLQGYLANAKSFKNGSSPIEQKGKKVEYINLKTQCYFLLADKINNDSIYITEAVASKKINARSISEHIADEVPVIKRDNANADGKLKLIPKDEMKKLLGHSPDFMDAIMMRIFFDLKQTTFSAPKIHIISR